METQELSAHILCYACLCMCVYTLIDNSFHLFNIYSQIINPSHFIQKLQAHSILGGKLIFTCGNEKRKYPQDYET